MLPILFFGDVLPFAFPGPIVGTGTLLLVAVSWWSCRKEELKWIETIMFLYRYASNIYEASCAFCLLFELIIF
jgi:hypothetical protein